MHPPPLDTRSNFELPFTSGQTLEGLPQLLRALCEVKQAAASANQRAAVLTPDVAQAIIVACRLVIAGEHRERFPADLFIGGGGIALHLNLNTVLAELASAQLPGQQVAALAQVGAGQSTADVVHTALRVALIRALASLESTLATLAATVRGRATELAAIRTLSRTCLQDALCDSLGAFLAGHAALLQRCHSRLTRERASLQHVNLGGTVVGSQAGAHPVYLQHVLGCLREVTGLPLKHTADLRDAAQNLDTLASTADALDQLGGALLKISRDLRLLASGPRGGFGELVLPKVGRGSSFFSDKNNPIVPETAMLVAFRISGMRATVRAALEHGELNLNVFEPLAGTELLRGCALLQQACGLLDSHCYRGLNANAARCAELAGLATPVLAGAAPAP